MANIFLHGCILIPEGFKGLLKKVSILRIEEVGVHTLRHTWISQMFSSGVPLPEVCRLAGYNNLIATQKYVRLIGDFHKLEASMNRMSSLGLSQQKDSEKMIRIR